MIDTEEITRRKIARGTREVNKSCHCGRPRWKHTALEAKHCMKNTKTVVTQVNGNDTQQEKL